MFARTTALLEVLLKDATDLARLHSGREFQAWERRQQRPGHLLLDAESLEQPVALCQKTRGYTPPHKRL